MQCSCINKQTNKLDFFYLVYESKPYKLEENQGHAYISSCISISHIPTELIIVSSDYIGIVLMT